MATKPKPYVVTLADLVPPQEWSPLWVNATPRGTSADDAQRMIQSAPPAWFLPGLSHPDAADAVTEARAADVALNDAIAAADAARDADAHLLATGSGKAKREAEARQAPHAEAVRAAHATRVRAWRKAAALVGKPGEEVTAARRAVLADALPAAHEAAIKALADLHTALRIRSAADWIVSKRSGIFIAPTKHTSPGSELHTAVHAFEFPMTTEAAK